MIENEKSGLNYDSSTYYLKSNMSVNNNNNFLKNINNNNFEMNNEKKEFKNTNFFQIIFQINAKFLVLEKVAFFFKFFINNLY